MSQDNPLLGTFVHCSVCGKAQELHYDRQLNETLTTLQLCFTCDHWRRHFEKDLGRSIRVEGVHYIPSEETGPERWRGFGGRKFKIRKHDGTVIETTNLWCQGHISPEWKDKLPDNAEFLND